MRASGILMGISSIPSKYGIGCFSKEAYDFVDQLEKAGQQYWQILPLGPTGYGDSPYQSVSTFAGNPYFIDLEELIKKELLTKEECEACDWGGSESYVDYEKIYLSRYKLLRKAYEKADLKTNPDYAEFLKEEKDWLQDYCLFMAIKNEQKGICWIDWPEELKDRHSKAVKEAEKELAEEIEFYRFQQYCFTTQWRKLKAYANKKGISIIGDVPIYVALDSSDAWANPEMLQFDEDYDPKAVAGCPPDAFSATGQLWGNPLYDWKALKKDGYGWWVQRMTHCLELYDVVRIDHFRGFDEYYAIPYGDKTAERGKWEKGPGMDLFHTLDKKIKDLRVIAEDLGFLTESVLEMLKESGYPGMKVLQFAFDGSEDSSYLPYKYDHNCVVYTGTHDNATCNEDYHTYDSNKRISLRRFFKNQGYSSRSFNEMLCQYALDTDADTVILPIWDICGFKEEARINTPGTVSNKNWTWKLKDFKTFPDKLMSTKEWIKKSNR